MNVRQAAILHGAQHQDTPLADMHVMGIACGVTATCALLHVQAYVGVAFATPGLALG